MGDQPATPGAPGQAPPPAPGYPQPPKAVAHTVQPRTVAKVAHIAAIAILAVAVWVMPIGFASMSPGPVLNVLGGGDNPVVLVSGRPVYRPEGRLDLLTVRVRGGPGNPLTFVDFLRGLVQPTMDLRPRAELFPEQQTAEEAQQESTQEMTNSQEDATAAALSELGVPVPTVLTITGTVKGSGAEGKLNPGDILTAVDDLAINDLSVLRAELKKRTPGDVLKVRVKRGSEETTVDLTTSKGAQGQTVMGVLLKAKYDFPVKANISVADIGGPSAGMVFGLAIYDNLTPGNLTGGKHIAGTGTLASDGVVGPIGGAPQKIHAAKQAGAQWFLVPNQNCKDIAGRVPEGIRPVRIDDFHAARVAVEQIARGDEGSLPTCPTE